MNRLLIIVLGAVLAFVGGCGSSAAGSGGVTPSLDCPLPFHSNFAPTLSVSTQDIVPTLQMTDISFNSTTTNSVTTANIIAGPTGVNTLPSGTWDGLLTTTVPAPPGESIVNAVATSPSSLLLASGPPALTISVKSCGGTSGGTPCPSTSLVTLTSSDFGMSAIINDVTPLSGSLIGDMTYSAFAGGTLPTTAVQTGIRTYTGKMIGVLADEPKGGGDDVAGNVTLNVNFNTNTITGSVNNISTTAGQSTIPQYFPFYTSGTISFTAGVIVGNSFSGTATASAIVSSPTTTAVRGDFYGVNGNEVTGTFKISVPNTTNPGRFLIGSFGGTDGVAAVTSKDCPTGPFYANFAPTLLISTVAATPTVLQTPTSFHSTLSGNSGTANVMAGPTGVSPDNIFVLASPFTDTLVNAVATLPSSMLLATGIPALTMTSTSLASSVGLTSSDFGEWAITNANIFSQGPSPVPLMTYVAYAGGTLPTLSTAMPTTTATYTGTMTGVLATDPLFIPTTIGGSDDVSGIVTLNLNFGAGTFSGLVSGITTTPGVSALLPTNVHTYTYYAPLQTPPLPATFADIALSGTISVTSFSGSATTPSITGAVIQQVSGNFYGPTGNEASGTLTISVLPIDVPPQPPGLILIGSFGAK